MENSSYSARGAGAGCMPPVTVYGVKAMLKFAVVLGESIICYKLN